MNKPICYTIGYAPKYDKDLGKLGFQKLGRTSRYVGGCIWKTVDSVKKYLANNSPRLDKYEIYIVQAQFNIDTAPDLRGYNFHNLLVTSPIIGKVS